VNFTCKDDTRKFFNFIKSEHNNYIIKKDFVVILKDFLDLHPGLEFLKVHPDFQEKYSNCHVVN
jgi:hypothetical protein